MKKLLAVLLLAALLLPSFAMAQEVVNVFNCEDYIADEVLDLFEKETGIKVNYMNYTGNEDMLVSLYANPGAYDVVFPSEYCVERLLASGDLSEINYDNIPNAQYVLPSLRDPSYDPGNAHSVPYMWGTVGLLYNKKLTGGEITSWESLFDPQYKGNVFMMDSVRDTIGVGLAASGYSMNSVTESELYTARDLLIKQKKDGMVKAYLVDETKDMMVGGEAAIALVWSGDALYAMEKNDDLAYCVPVEGSNIWVDAMCIPKASEKKEAAQVFIDFMCRPEIAFKNQQYIYYSTPVQAVADTMYSEEEKANLTLNPTQDIIDRCEFFKDVSEYNDLYEAVWMNVKQAQ